MPADEQDFYERLDHMMDVAARSLKVKREVITKLLDGGLYPYTKRYLGTFANHFSTIGLIGMNEACLNAKWIRKDLVSSEGQKFTKEVLNHMKNRLVDLPGGVRRSLQPGGDSGGVHHLPSGKARQGQVSGYHHRRMREGRNALLYQQLPPSGCLYVGCIRRAGYPGRAADHLYLRNRVPCVLRRKDA